MNAVTPKDKVATPAKEVLRGMTYAEALAKMRLPLPAIAVPKNKF